MFASCYRREQQGFRDRSLQRFAAGPRQTIAKARSFQAFEMTQDNWVRFAEIVSVSIESQSRDVVPTTLYLLSALERLISFKAEHFGGVRFAASHAVLLKGRFALV